MAYRYIFHLLGAVTDMYTARKARTVAVDTDARHGRAFVAASAGALFGKAHALSEEVYLAMVSRGYTGDVRTLDAAKVRTFDVVCGATAIAAALVLVGIDRGL
jgi:energy-coupling factor transporter transmembrane protein EcfT